MNERFQSENSKDVDAWGNRDKSSTTDTSIAAPPDFKVWHGVMSRFFCAKTVAAMNSRPKMPGPVLPRGTMSPFRRDLVYLTMSYGHRCHELL